MSEQVEEQKVPQATREEETGSSSSSTTQPPSLIKPPDSFLRSYFYQTGTFETLHAMPTMLTILISMCVFLPVALTIQAHVLDTTSHLTVFFVGSILVTVGYYIAFLLLYKLSSSFGRLSRDKQIYAVSNLLKASVLASLAPLAVHQIIVVLLYDEWDSHKLKNLGCLYALPDFVSLLMVRRMNITTVIHHVAVVCFNFYSISERVNYEQDGVCRLIVVYGCFSSFSYIVYVLLASRFLGVNSTVSRNLSAGALLIYVVMTATNWSMQASYLVKLLRTGEHNLSCFIYSSVVAFVMHDDLLLNRWLLENVRARKSQNQQVLQSVLIRNNNNNNNNNNKGESNDNNNSNYNRGEGAKKKKKRSFMMEGEEYEWESGDCTSPPSSSSLCPTRAADDDQRSSSPSPTAAAASNKRLVDRARAIVEEATSQQLQQQQNPNEHQQEQEQGEQEHHQSSSSSSSLRHATLAPVRLSRKTGSKRRETQQN